jgi:antitoxin ParD1/3/4
MSKTTSFALGDHFNQFLTEQIATGRYGSATEGIRAGLRLLEEREAALEELRAEIRKGEESGVAEGFDIDVFFDQMMAGDAARGWTSRPLHRPIFERFTAIPSSNGAAQGRAFMLTRYRRGCASCPSAKPLAPTPTT